VFATGCSSARRLSTSCLRTTPDLPGAAAATSTSFGKHAFTGTVKWVTIVVGDDSHDHLIDKEDLIRIAMSIQ